jgi:hypothetical protein
VVWQTGDGEPESVDVLISDRPKRYLARFQHGWVWTSSRREVTGHTPLTWKFATSADVRGKCVVRRLTDAEIAAWTAS